MKRSSIPPNQYSTKPIFLGLSFLQKVGTRSIDKYFHFFPNYPNPRYVPLKDTNSFAYVNSPGYEAKEDAKTADKGSNLVKPGSGHSKRKYWNHLQVGFTNWNLVKKYPPIHPVWFSHPWTFSNCKHFAYTFRESSLVRLFSAWYYSQSLNHSKIPSFTDMLIERTFTVSEKMCHTDMQISLALGLCFQYSRVDLKIWSCKFLSVHQFSKRSPPCRLLKFKHWDFHIFKNVWGSIFQLLAYPSLLRKHMSNFRSSHYLKINRLNKFEMSMWKIRANYKELPLIWPVLNSNFLE